MEGFQAQKAEVIELLKKNGTFDASRITSFVEWLYAKLGLPVFYFEHNSAEEIAKNIESLLAAKILAEASGSAFDIQLRQEGKDKSLFATRSLIAAGEGDGKVVRLGEALSHSPVHKLERYLEQRFLTGSFNPTEEGAGTGASGIVNQLRRDVPSESLSFVPGSTSVTDNRVFRLQAYRSSGILDEATGARLRLYFVQAPNFANPTPDKDETSLQQLGDKEFLATTDKFIIDLYQSVMNKAVKTLGPVIEVVSNFVVEKIDKQPSSAILVAHRVGTTHSYFTGIPDVYRAHGMYATHKFVEPFSNNVVIFAFLLRPLDRAAGASFDLQSCLTRIADDASLHFVLPRTSLTPLLSNGSLTALETAYAYAAWKFAFHFISRANDEFSRVQTALRTTSNVDALSVLSKLRMALKTHSFVEGSLLDAIFRNTQLVKWLYNDFAARHAPGQKGSVPNDEEGYAHLRRVCSTEADLGVFLSFFSFNRHVLKTNLYRPHKTALSFRLDPSFLPRHDYPETPYGVFFIVGSEFRGFHVRFQDIARGGVRLVRSNYSQDFATNTASVFDECYGLANTQQRKNKDIPEGGSKGIILLNLAHQDKGRVAFQKFVDGLLDLLLPHDAVVDRLGKTEILFLGPDEGTADVMDWASQHAKSRGYPYWKAFTTGKSQSIGGIPHDIYGMTTHGVRAYVEGIQRKLNLDGTQCTKVQTGGPDGDLGSNEIKEGNERTIAVVDGSGVLCDPKGIHPTELKRLATLRQTVDHFDCSLLSSEGFFVHVNHNDVKLPNGTVVENGTAFRNHFHLNAYACGDFFVPCGGRPAAVNGDNVRTFIYRPGEGDKRVLRYKYIVEGANLFFTQDARLALEAAGVVVYKDASANKGGVTSSSLEVLAALSLSDEEFSKHMQVTDAKNPPAFYEAYVKEVQNIIRRNAELEFECMWREHKHSNEPLSIISDKLSVRITTLSVVIEKADTLWANVALRTKVLRNAIPKTLASTIGFDTVVQRLPETYVRALFASHIASRFVYTCGLAQSDFAFYEFVEKYV